MSTNETDEGNKFILLPAVSGGGALIRRNQIAGARANGADGSIVYAICGPSIYTTASISQLSQYIQAESMEVAPHV